MNIITTQNLSKTYHPTVGGEVKAVDNVNLEVEKGHFLTIIGASGSGKTTLLNGTDLSNLKENERVRFRREKVGFVFQAFNLIQTLTAIENVEAALAPTGMPKNQRVERSQTLLENVGLQQKMHHLPVELSAGEQQRVAIARAFANEPQILLLDEPTGNLDTTTGKEIMGLCHRTSREQGQTVVAVTHANYVKEYTDQVLYMKDGKLYNQPPE